MPQNRSGSYSPKKPIRRSGSTTARRKAPPRARPAPEPARVHAVIASEPAPPRLPQAEPLPPPPPPKPSYAPTSTALLLLLGGFLLIHIALDLFLDLSPGDVTRIQGARLLEIFIFWVPILFLAAFVGLGNRRGVRWPIRLAVLAGYALLVGILGFVATSAPDDAPSCALDGGQAHCVGASYFDLFFRLAPIPGFFFLFGNGRHRWTVGQCFGLALATFTLWRGIYGSFPDLLVIAGGGAVLGPTPAIQWYRSFFLKGLWEVAYVVAGLFFIFRRVPGIHKPFTWGRELESVLRPLGAWTRRSVGTDLAWGAVLFLVVAISSSLFAQLLAQGPTGQVGDDSRVFEEMTIDLVFLLAIAAGVGEEIVFRGFLQSALGRLIPFRGWPRLGAWMLGGGAALALVLSTALAFVLKDQAPTQYAGLTHLGVGVLLFLQIGALVGVASMIIGWGGFGVAILLQGIAFGLVHAGYGDLDHLILPLMFGLIAGIIYRIFGLLPIILIHVEIDVYAFASSYTGAASQALTIGLSLLFLAQVAFAIIWLVMRLIGWLESRRRVAPVIVRS